MTKTVTRNIFVTASPKMILLKGVQPHLATVAKDEKIWFPMTFFTHSLSRPNSVKDSGNHSPDEQRKRGGAILKGVAMTSSNF